MRWLLLALLLSGCVSTELRKYVGGNISEAKIAYGAPEQIIALPDGQKAYQFRSAGGAFVIPGSANTSVVQTGSVATIHTAGTPGVIVQTNGCLLTFIVGQDGVINDIRVPKGLAC